MEESYKIINGAIYNNRQEAYEAEQKILKLLFDYPDFYALLSRLDVIFNHFRQEPGNEDSVCANDLDAFKEVIFSWFTAQEYKYMQKIVFEFFKLTYEILTPEDWNTIVSEELLEAIRE